MENKFKGAVVAGLAVAVSGFANAAAPDFSSLTGAVDLSSVGTAILAIGAILAAPAVIKTGVRIVLSMIR
ncbi:MAG: hypothetical protein QM788_17495 [Roseateles sp.]|uniref:hypothetical protein n=1 Tax=Roseateles sp. TaxID=1971397 RepID=UPI0039E97B9D